MEKEKKEENSAEERGSGRKNGFGSKKEVYNKSKEGV
jgi:hypothetical protein